MTTTVGTAQRRFKFIDALRGIAAVAVVCHHAYGGSALNPLLVAQLPGWVGQVVVEYGARGVQTFFVISGFVIAHSLRATPMTPKACGQFIVRRQLRLDPPYWAMLAIILLLYPLRRAVPSAVHQSFPSWPAIAANFTYTHCLLLQPPLLVVAWTLGIEVQFYLAFMLVLAAARRPGPTRVAVLLLLLTALAGVCTDPNLTWEARWAVHTWPYFVAGVFCYWAVQRQLSPAWMAAVLVALLASATWFGLQSPVVVGVVTACLIFGVGRMGRLHTGGDNRPLQFLGRISYSLYLTHVLVLSAVQHFTLTLARRSPLWVVPAFLLSVLLTIVAAYPFYRWIELPSMRLATRFKRDPGPSAATGFGQELPPVELAST